MPTYTVSVGGVAKDVLLKSFNIRTGANAMHVLTVDVDSEDASYRPSLDDEIIVTEDATRIFGGYIISTRESAHDGQVALPAIVTRVTANDFRGLAQRRYVNATIPAGNVKAALQALDPYYTDYGVTLSGSQVDGPMLPELTYRWTRLDQVLSDISRRTADSGTPLLWEINYQKVLSLYDPAGRAAFAFTEVAGVYTNAKQFGDLVVEASRDDTYANRVIVLGPEISATGYVDTFTGDGVTDTFPLSINFEYGYGFVSVNGVNEGFNAVPTLNPAGGSEWDLLTSSNSIQRVAGVPANGDVITVMYNGTGAPYAMAESVPDQVSPRGIWEKVINSDAAFSNAAAQDLADAILAQSLVTALKAEYPTERTDVAAGDSQSMVSAKRNLNSSFIVNGVDLYNEPGSEKIVRRVTAIEGSYARNPMQLYRDWLGGGSTGQSSSAITAAPTIGTILLATATLTHAQIAALPSTSLTVVSAPGANYRLVPIKAEVETRFSASYTNLDPDASLGVSFAAIGSPDTLGGKAFRRIQNYGGSPGLGSPASALFLDDLLGSGARLAQLTPFTETGPLPSVEEIDNIENLAIVVGLDNQGLGDLTGGDSDNAMRVAVWYAVMPCLLAPVSVTVPAGSLVFSIGGTWVFVAPDGTDLPTPSGSPTNSGFDVINGGLVALDSGEFCEVSALSAASVLDADLSSLGSESMAAVLSVASNLSDGFYVIDGTSIVRLNTAGNVVQTWTSVGSYEMLGVSTDNAKAYLASNNIDHVDVYDLAGSIGPTTFVTESGFSVAFGGSMIQVLRSGHVLVGWFEDATDDLFVKLYDASGSLIDTFPIGTPADDDFLVALSLADDDLSFWVSYWADASNVVRVRQIQISDASVLHSFDKTTGLVAYDNAPFAVVRVDIP